MIKEKNKAKTIFIAILAGCNVIADILTPILIILLWAKIFGLTGIGENILVLIALLATTFRGLKFWIGKDNE